MTKLAPCPDSPNCVQSIDSTQPSYIAPFTSEQHSIEVLWSKLKQVLAKRPRTKLVEEQTEYLKYTAISKLLRFKDDLEFMLDMDKGCIHVRSASRVGYSDFGANRKRVEKIRAQLTQ